MKVVFNENHFNNIRMINLNKDETEKLEKMSDEDRYKYCEREYEILTKDPDTAKLLLHRHHKKGLIFGVASNTVHNKVYLVQTIQVEPEFENVKIIINDLTDENVNDFLAIAKLLDKHLVQMGNQYKEQILNTPAAFKDFMDEHTSKKDPKLEPHPMTQEEREEMFKGEA